jgi:hypothetical protein
MEDHGLPDIEERRDGLSEVLNRYCEQDPIAVIASGSEEIQLIFIDQTQRLHCALS